MKEIVRCKRCVMDNGSDDTISFDANGYCNYCTEALSKFGKVYFPNEEGNRRLGTMLAELKEHGKEKKYDCIMGLSGGLDSSYLAYLGYKWGLRILAVHIDDGYDTEISKSNLENLIQATHFDYKVITPDAEQFNALTLAYMKAGVPNLAIPQDNVLFAFLYKNMKKYSLKYFLSGGNFALECILQHGNTYKATDVINIKSIHKKYGTKPIDKLEFLSTLERKKDEYILGIKTLRPLNYIDYNRDRAFRELKRFCDFAYYGRKHLENILTAFVQCYWFPKKFGVDKRTSHLSSMIVSGQMTRAQAMRELDEPLYDEMLMSKYIRLIKINLHISDQQFDEIMSSPTHQHTDYQTEDEKYFGFSAMKKIYKILK
ncbi:MAG: N-acetyl sugar amidotransferase [Lachnospiraceae bacterium]|nr:N-acetyl sugar amidotransferase [Schwartzia sp. (in: firmicutes)]MBR1629793.1 N-acetyl sugar amidotransferase [Lachnospiraceae bacterium]